MEYLLRGTACTKLVDYACHRIHHSVTKTFLVTAGCLIFLQLLVILLMRLRLGRVHVEALHLRIKGAPDS